MHNLDKNQERIKYNQCKINYNIKIPTFLILSIGYYQVLLRFLAFRNFFPMGNSLKKVCRNIPIVKTKLSHCKSKF